MGTAYHTDELSLLLRLVNAFQAVQEQLGRIHNSEVDIQVFREVFLDLLALIQSHYSVFRYWLASILTDPDGKRNVRTIDKHSPES